MMRIPILVTILATAVVVFVGCEASINEKPEHKAKAQMDILCRAIVAFREDNGRAPNAEEGLDVLVFRKEADSEESVPYLVRPRMLFDPFGRKFSYAPPDESGLVELEMLEGPGTDSRRVEFKCQLPSKM